MVDYLTKNTKIVISNGQQTVFILIFKTNIRLKKDIKIVASYLTQLVDIISWNIDREDIDNVLRIEAKNDSIKKIITTIIQAGYFCEELKN